MPRGPETSRTDAAEAQRTSPRRRDPVTWLVICGSLLITAIVMGTVVIASGFRERALENARRELDNTVLLLARHFQQKFEDAEIVAKDAIERLQLSSIASQESFRQRMTEQSVHDLLHGVVTGLSYIGDLNIIDSDGHIINSSGDGPLPPIVVSDRAYFQTLKSNPPPENFVMQPVESRVTGKWTMIVAHRLTGADGIFLGLLTRRIDAESYERFLESMTLSPDSSITIFHYDGTLLGRYPRVEGLIGKKYPNGDLRTAAMRSGARQTGFFTSPIDNIVRLSSTAPVSRFPILAIATKTEAAALADWYSQTWLLSVTATLVVIVVVAMIALVVRQIVRQNRDATLRLEAEKQRVDTALDNMTQGLVLYDADARIVMFNQRFIDLLGLSGEVIKPGCHLRDLMEHCRQRGAFDGDVDQFCATVSANVATGRTRQATYEIKSGRSFNVIDKPLPQGGWVTTIEDISHRRALERERDRNHAFLREIIDHIPSQITVKDIRDRRYVLVNRVAEQHFLRSRDNLIGKTVFDLFPQTAAEQITADDDRAITRPDGLFMDEYPTQSLALGPRYVTSHRIAIHDDTATPRYLINVVEDVTERREAAEKITRLAHFDALTELPNRVLFREQLDRELERARHGKIFALLYIDIDEFKGINDSLGHHVGDELLKTVAERIKSCIKAADMVARLGGDEFAVLLTSIDARDDVVAAVQRIFESIRTPYHCLGHQLTSDASIGVAMAPLDGTEPDELTKNADLAMYAAKAGGRRTFRFFEPAMDESARFRLQMEQDMRRALADGQFEIHYQPLVDLTDNSMTGCEALLRWRHPELGMIPPLDFIPLAEDTGFINEIGDWVLRTACAEAAAWPPHIRLAVNVSPVQLKSPTLALRVASALAASGLAPGRLEIEITEAVLIHDDDSALKILHELHHIGVRIALDDFGTGYSSLSYLKRFPFDKIKIDRCFVSDIEIGGSSAIVQAVVNIATASNMTTTAEGVETGQQQRMLRQLGCTEMQGYLFSAPKPPSEVRKLFAANAMVAATEESSPIQAAG
ncbi:EAL domain-containing protein [Bradyrhizobium sp. STM 3557]|uniref:bifunctional diguanylate cyclase/phosphodiesterase n=1 Tax=Bradyrhizobium sp. STM 3557 TaxID=578920 RepID=UPI00388F3A7F